MTLSHDETNARLLELVYDEATPAERAALEAHVATCAECRAELAALGATRAQLRVALDDAPVPARAHARILEAAAQAVAAPAVQAPAPARAIVPPSASSPWERLRSRWTFPTIATVGAVAIVLIASKVFLDPQRTIDRGREAVAPAEPPVTRPAESKKEERAPTADESAAFAERTRAMVPGGLSPALGGLMGKRMSESLMRRHRESANLHGAASSEGAGAGTISAGGLGSSAARGQAQPEAPASAFASPPSDWKGGAPGNGPSASPSPPATAPPAPPAPRASPVASPVASPAPRRMQKLSDANALDGLAAGAPASKKSARDDVAGAEVADKERAAALDENEKKPAPEPKAEERAKDALTQDALARRAERLFAARRWSAAIADYRELIRRFPDADLKPRWSARITRAQAASDAEVAARKSAIPAKASKEADVVPVGE